MVLDKHLQTHCVTNRTVNFQKACMLCHTKVDRSPTNLAGFFLISGENTFGKVKRKNRKTNKQKQKPNNTTKTKRKP